MKLVLMIFTAIFLQSCSQDKFKIGKNDVDVQHFSIENGVVSSNCEEGKNAFRETLYPLLLERCASCHDGSLAKAPPHSSSDEQVAYETSLKYLNKLSINNSLFVRKVRSRHWEDSDGNYEGMTVLEMTEALNSWMKEGESGCSDFQDEMSTMPYKIEDSVGSREKNSFSNVELSLAHFGEDFQSVKVVFKLQEFTPPSNSFLGSYLIKDLRIVNTEKSKHLEWSGINFFLNKKKTIYENIYSDLSGVISDSNEAGVLVSTETMIITRSQKDREFLQLTFDQLRMSEESSNCSEMEKVKNEIYNTPTFQTCLECHGDTKPAENILNLTVTPDNGQGVCFKLSSRINKKFIARSTLLQVLSKGQHIKLRPSIYEEVSKWITKL